MTDMPHLDFLEEASAYALGALDADERREFEAHLAGCEICRAEVASHRRVTAALGLGEPAVAPPAALKARTIARVTGQRTPAVSPPVAPPPEPDVISPAADSSRAWLALAAALLLAAAAGAYAWVLRSHVSEMEQVQAAADRQLHDLRNQLALARTDAQRMSSALDVLAAADLVRVEMSTSPRPAAPSGRAFWSRSRGLLLSASGLPPAGAGRTYQIWLVAPNQPPMGAGFLTVSSAGSGVAILHPAPPAAPTATTMTVAITNEPTGGSPGPTTPILLAGSAKTTQ